MISAHEIAAALDLHARRSGPWSRSVCPVHGSRTGYSQTLALRDGEHGLIAVCHAGCSRADILAELARRGLIGRSDDRRPDSVTARGVDRDDADRRIEAARRI